MPPESLDLWHHPAGTTESQRDRDDLLVRWLSSDDSALWAQAIALMGRPALSRWFQERGSQGFSPRDGECWRIAFGLPPGSVAYAEDLVPWCMTIDDEQAFHALVA